MKDGDSKGVFHDGGRGEIYYLSVAKEDMFLYGLSSSRWLLLAYFEVNELGGKKLRRGARLPPDKIRKLPLRGQPVTLWEIFWQIRGERMHQSGAVCSF
jgi:hypothetical protein